MIIKLNVNSMADVNEIISHFNYNKSFSNKPLEMFMDVISYELSMGCLTILVNTKLKRIGWLSGHNGVSLIYYKKSLNIEKWKSL